jgi:general secretion pathway protein H
MVRKVGKITTRISRITKLRSKGDRLQVTGDELQVTGDGEQRTVACCHLSHVTRHLSPQSGLTLIEIIITVAIIGLIMGLSTGVFQDFLGAALSSTADKLVGTIKYVYNEAAIKNQYYRLVIDMNDQTFSVEASSDPFKISASEEGTYSPNPDETAPKTNPSDNEKPAGSSEGEGKPPPSGGGFSSTSSYLLKPIKLPEGVRIKDVFVAHAGKKIEGGKTAIYFFPNGWVEKAVINLTDEKGETFYSLETNPTTGKTKIRTEYFDYKPEEEKP